MLQKSAALYGVAFFLGLGLNVLGPMLPALSSEFRLENLSGLAWLGGVNTLLVFFPMSLLSLLNAARGGRFVRISLTMAVLLLSPAFTLAASAKGAALFSAGNFLIGSFLGLAVPALYASAKGVAAGKDEMQTAVNVNILLGVGLACGQLAAAWITETYSWRAVYGALAGLSLIAAPVARMLPLPQNESNHITTVPRSARMLLIQYLPGSIPWGGLTVFIFPYLSRAGIPPSHTAILITILGAGMVAGAFLAGEIGKRIGRERTRLIALVCACLLLSVATAFWILEWSAGVKEPWRSLLYFAGGMILAVPGASIKGLLFESARPEDTHTIFSIENFLESAGKGFGPAAVSLLVWTLGDLRIGLMASCLFWLMCIPSLLLFVREEQR